MLNVAQMFSGIVEKLYPREIYASGGGLLVAPIKRASFVIQVPVVPAAAPDVCW